MWNTLHDYCTYCDPSDQTVRPRVLWSQELVWGQFLEIPLSVSYAHVNREWVGKIRELQGVTSEKACYSGPNNKRQGGLTHTFSHSSISSFSSSRWGTCEYCGYFQVFLVFFFFFITMRKKKKRIVIDFFDGKTKELWRNSVQPSLSHSTWQGGSVLFLLHKEGSGTGPTATNWAGVLDLSGIMWSRAESDKSMVTSFRKRVIQNLAHHFRDVQGFSEDQLKTTSLSPRWRRVRLKKMCVG